MIKIAFLSGRPKDGTLLPKSERYVWKEVCRVLKNDLQFFKEGFEFLIPIYNKFDLQALRIAEELGTKTTYYLPSKEWGTKNLPFYQLDLISRMRKEEVIVEGNVMKRMFKMIEDADIVYLMDETDGLERFTSSLKNKVIRTFPKEKMLYTTEEEAKEYFNELNKKTTTFISPGEVSLMQKHKELESVQREETKEKYSPLELISTDCYKPYDEEEKDDDYFSTFSDTREDVREEMEQSKEEETAEGNPHLNINEEELDAWIEELNDKNENLGF